MNTKSDVFTVMSCPRCHTGQIEGDKLACPDCGYTLEDEEFNELDYLITRKGIEKITGYKFEKLNYIEFAKEILKQVGVSGGVGR